MAIAVVVVVDILATHTTTDEMVSVQIDTIETIHVAFTFTVSTVGYQKT